VKQGKRYSFAAKGGHNCEPHNHNDIGSFIIVTSDDDIPLADFGCAIYRKETFDPQKRYTLFNNSSRGHSVPIVNGEYQKDGKNFAARNVKAGDDFFEADIEGAYEANAVKKINRRFELKESSVILCDTIECSEKTQSITERLVSWTKPELHEGYVDLKSAKILYDSKKYCVSISQEQYRNHTDTEDITAYLIDFSAKKSNETEFKFEMIIQ